eukprot:UN26569
MHKNSEFLPDETKEASGFTTDKILITTIDPVFYGLGPALGRHEWFIEQHVQNKKTDFDRLYTKKTVHELLFGYETDGVKLFPGFNPTYTKETDPDYTDIHTIYIGKSNPENIYQYKVWRGQSDVRVKCPWEIECPSGDFPCCRLPSPVYAKSGLVDKDNPNTVTGSTGDQFVRHPGEYINIWLDIITRNLTLKYERTVDYEGIPNRRYEIDRREFLNYTNEARNWKFYQYKHNGLFNITMVQQGLPLFGSYPHFL